MSYKVFFSNDSLSDIEKHRKSGKKIILKKIENLITEISITPRTGTAKPEQLKWFAPDEIWSRRIDKKHRLTYRVVEENKKVEVIAVYGHYNDK